MVKHKINSRLHLKYKCVFHSAFYYYIIYNKPRGGGGIDSQTLTRFFSSSEHMLFGKQPNLAQSKQVMRLKVRVSNALSCNKYGYFELWTWFFLQSSTHCGYVYWILIENASETMLIKTKRKTFNSNFVITFIKVLLFFEQML